MITTDMVYYAAGSRQEPGAMVTASHNPQGWNGIKLCLSGAAPVGAGTGLEEVQRLTEAPPPPASAAGEVHRVDVLPGYVDHLLSIVDPSRLAGLRVAADGGNGVAGVAVPAVFDRVPATLIGLYLEPDGRFPNHHPDPLRPENLRDLEALMRRERPDLGVAFDGDADRAFFVDDALRPLPGSTVTAMVAQWFLRREPGSAVVHNLICSRAVPETIRRAGGVPVRSRVGHSFIKGVMKETGAIFGGEHSGHYYYRDNYRADSGILTMLVLMQVVAEDGRPLSEIRAEFEPYAQSGEINLRGRRPGGGRGGGGGRLRRRGAGPGRRAHRVVERPLVQPASVEHRAGAAAQRRGPRRRGGRATGGPGAGRAGGGRRCRCLRTFWPSWPAPSAAERWRIAARRWPAPPAGGCTRSATAFRSCFPRRPTGPERSRGRDLDA